ncbi:MAG: LPXTG cell wall anchor domain-containing protein [Acutalibacteraceae bacterium]
MKGFIKKTAPLLAALALVLCSSVTALADGTVTYDGNAGGFIFEKGSEYSPTDLFDGFKDVMPGDTLTQKITVKNDAANKVKVKIYIRSLGAKQDSGRFLSQLELSVAKAQDNEAAYMFDATAEKTDSLTDWVLLGTLYSGGEVNLDVGLKVPVTMDNEFQKAVGSLDWQFKVEELPVDADDPKPPKTGESDGVIIWITGGFISLSALILLSVFKKKVLF